MRALILVVLCALPIQAGLSWKEGLVEAMEEAGTSGKPVLMDFQAPWCYSCYYMDEHVLGRMAFAKAAEGLVLLKVDVDREEGRKLKERHRVTFLPTYVVLDPKGRDIGRIVGEQTEGDFLARLGALLGADRGRGALDQAVERLKGRLAANDYGLALKEVRALPPETRKSLDQRKDWRILRARLHLLQAVRRGGSGEPVAPPEAERDKAVGALLLLLSLEDSCELAYDAFYAERLLDSLPRGEKEALLEAERRALEKVVESRLFVPPAMRCADFRSPIEALAEVYGKLGRKEKRIELLSRAVGFLDRQGRQPGEDRNNDDNLRFFLELSGDEGRLDAHFRALIEAYPSDYVYGFRYAKFLRQRGRPQDALPWIEKADRLCYGANRLAVTKVRAQILSDLGRKKEAQALLRRDIKAGKRSFPKEAAQLEAVLEEVRK